MTTPVSPDAVCAACGTAGSGRFCANCGATLQGTTCAECNASLSPGARFCHRCGKPTGAMPPGTVSSISEHATPKRGGVASSLPWAVAAIALLALLAMSAGKFFNVKRGSTLDAPQNALPQAGLDDRGTASASGDQGPDATASAVRGPDISSLSPEERAERLFNRVMILNSEGKSDSVLFFAPMAINAYQMLPRLSADQRYDMGRVAEVAGALPLARAEADTILLENPNHLLGLILAGRVASLSGDTAARKRHESKFLAVEKTETAKKLREYELHQADIAKALADARRTGGTRG